MGGSTPLFRLQCEHLASQSDQKSQFWVKKLADDIESEDKVLDDLATLYHELWKDVKTSLGRGKTAHKSQFHRRALIRSIFAMIEGAIFSLKQVVVFADSIRGRKLGPNQLALLQEKIPELSESGEPRIRSANIKLKANLQFSFAMFAEIHGLSERLDLSGSGWQALGRSIKVRDRLMHPKVPQDLQISDIELKDVIDGFSWFQTSFGSLFAAANKSLKKQIDDLKKQPTPESISRQQ